MKNKMKPCDSCGQEIATSAKTCPHCGAKNKKPIFKKWWFWLLVVVVIGVAASGGNSKESPSNLPSAPVSSAPTQTKSPVPQPSEASKSSSVEDPSVPTEYRSALRKAETYSDMMHMSKAAIFDQLTSEYGEKFSTEAAQYAMDNIVADWNANALAKAESYSDTMHMSKAGIYDQLTSEYGEQFTAEEAQYAVDNLDADWNANALAKAKSYQNTMNMSPAAIHDQLTSEYGEQFTAEQADYAIAHLD